MSSLVLALLLISNVSAQVVILQQPQSMTVLETRKGMFVVEANAGGLPMGYQWQRDGQDIPGATGKVFVTDVARLVDNGAKFRAVISAEGLESATSEQAVLSVIGWEVPPMIIQAGRRTATSVEIVVVFSTRVDVANARLTNNWSVDGGASVVEVTRGRSDAEFVLTSENLAPNANYHLTARNIRDWAGNRTAEQTAPITLASPDPSLSLTYAASTITITWRVQNYLYDPFELEFSSNIGNPNLWYPIGPVQADGDVRTYRAATTAGARFFRLRRVE